jgi:hypothetical protein
MTPEFNDATWTAGRASVGYEIAGNDYAGLIQTSVPPGTTSVYIRIPFTVTSSSVILDTLQMKYDDGFIAYLNGSPIANANAPASPGYTSTATDLHADSLAVQYVNFPVRNFSIKEAVLGPNYGICPPPAAPRQWQPSRALSRLRTPLNYRFHFHSQDGNVLRR